MPHQLPISYPKIHIPRRRADILSRPRLLQELNENLIDHTLNLIAAPAGSGKTTLLVDYAHQQEMPVCWYALDELDRDMYRFVAHFISAIQQQFSSFGDASTDVLNEAKNLVRSIPQLVITIVNDIYHHIRENFVIVLDDYHLVHGTTEIDQFVDLFTQQVSDNCHLVLASRTLPTLENTILLAARQQLFGLDFDLLAFKVEEVQALILQNDKRTITTQEAEELVLQTDGWVTGLNLSATNRTRPRPMFDRIGFQTAGFTLDTYFDEQVFDPQSPEIQQLLLDTALMEVFDAQLCADVLGDGQDWDALLQRIIENNLFVVGIDLPGHWIRYHHLFRDYLRHKLNQNMPEHGRTMRQKLADVYAARKEWDKAQHFYNELGDYAASAELIGQSLRAFGKTGRFHTLLRWIKNLPESFVAQRPDLLALQGSCSIELGDTAAMTMLYQAEQPLRAQNDLPLLAHLLLARATGHRIRRDYQASHDDVEALLHITADHPEILIERAGGLRLKGLHLYDQGRFDESLTLLNQALELYRRFGDISGVSVVYQNMGMVYRLLGAYNKAEEAYRKALEQWQQSQNIARQANVLNSLGVLQHVCGRYHQACITLEDAIAQAKQIGSPRLEAFALASLGDVYADLDAFFAAHTSYERAREIAETIEAHSLSYYVNILQAACWRREGQFKYAQALLAQVTVGHSPYEKGLHTRELGLLALAKGDTAEAFVHLQQACVHFEQGDIFIEQVQVQLYLAVAAVQAKQNTTQHHLDKAFQLTDHLDNQHVLFAAAYQMRDTLHLLQDPRIKPLIEQTIHWREDNAQQRKQLRQQTTTISLAPPSLVVKSLGVIELYDHHLELDAPEWQKHKKVKGLLFLLLENKRGLTKEEIGVHLWPDASPQSLKTAFKNALYRLRLAIGKGMINYDELYGRYSFNHTADYEWDVEQFKLGLKTAVSMTDPAEKLTVYHETLKLYQGEYLPTIDGNWVETARATLWRQYHQASLKCGNLALQRQQYDIAISCGHDLIQFDPYDEEAYRLLMRSYAARGNKAEVHRQFAACQEALTAGLGIEPSDQTNDLYQLLI